MGLTELMAMGIADPEENMGATDPAAIMGTAEPRYPDPKLGPSSTCFPEMPVGTNSRVHTTTLGGRLHTV